MNSVVLLIVFAIVWATIAFYLFYLDRSLKSLKKKLAFREKLEEHSS